MTTEDTEGGAVDPLAIARATQALMRGGLVAMPTETVYGLAADADQPAAVTAVFDAKGRPQDHPLILHIAHADAASHWARDIPPTARRLMQQFWPGPLTLILWRSARASDQVTGGQDTVGLRCPAGPWAQSLLHSLAVARGDPSVALAAPSANRYGRISPTRAEHVRADLGEKPGGRVDVILDGGACSLGIESTIVDCTGSAPRILRPGSISREQISRAVDGPVTLAPDDVAAPRVSGRLLVHYAPNTPMELLSEEAFAARVRALHPQRIGALARAAFLAALPCSGTGSVALGLPAAAAPTDFAHDLYAQLRRLDAAGLDRILVLAPPATDAWTAVNDRLRRAAAGADCEGTVPD